MTKPLDEPFKISRICRKTYWDFYEKKITKDELLERMEKLKNKQLGLKLGKDYSSLIP